MYSSRNRLLKIVFLDRGTFRVGINLPELDFAHNLEVYDRTKPDEVISRLQGADIAIVNKIKLGNAELSSLPNLKMIAITATGMDNIDLESCRRRGIQVANVADYANHTVPEHVFALILALRRSLIGFRSDVANGTWSKAEHFCIHTHPILDLVGSTIGIFGRGAHGQAVGRIAEAFGMRVLYADRKDATSREGYTPFDQVLSESDIVTLHCPLTPETRHMISEREFTLMERQPILINVSRGALIDEQALLHAVGSGAVSGVGLDVLSVEPPTHDLPLLAIADRPDVIITPHVAWASERAMHALMDRIAHYITCFVTGSPRP